MRLEVASHKRNDLYVILDNVCRVIDVFTKFADNDRPREEQEKLLYEEQRR